MPQLDPNSFIYQYIGIISILIIVYILLSYVALPSLLRIIILRKYFVQKSYSKVSSSLIVRNATVLKLKDSTTLLVTNKIINNIFSISKNLLVTLTTLSAVLHKNENLLLKKHLNTLNFSAFYSVYITLLLIIDNE